MNLNLPGYYHIIPTKKPLVCDSASQRTVRRYPNIRKAPRSIPLALVVDEPKNTLSYWCFWNKFYIKLVKIINNQLFIKILSLKKYIYIIRIRESTLILQIAFASDVTWHTGKDVLQDFQFLQALSSLYMDPTFFFIYIKKLYK